MESIARKSDGRRISTPALKRQQVERALRERGSYGYRRATILVNREFGARYNRKRIQRVMRLTTPALAVTGADVRRLMRRAAFVHTLRHDYLDGADRASAERVLEQVPAWTADYNEKAPHSSLGMKSPLDYRRLVQTLHAETCLTK